MNRNREWRSSLLHEGLVHHLSQFILPLLLDQEAVMDRQDWLSAPPKVIHNLSRNGRIQVHDTQRAVIVR